MTTDSEIYSIGAEVRDEAMKQLMKESMGWMGSSSDEWKEYIAKIPMQYSYWTERTPEDFQPLIDELVETRRVLMTQVPGRVLQVKNDVRDWQGNGADAFDEAFLGVLDGVQANQTEVAAQLVRVLCSEQEIVRASRKDIVDIGRRTLEALQKLDDEKSSGGMFKGALSIVAAIGAGLAIAAACLASGGAATGAALWAIRLTVLGGLVSTGGAIAGELMAAEITGDTVAEVLISMHDAIKNLRDYVREQEQALADALKDDAVEVDNAMAAPGRDGLVPPVVPFIYDPNPAGFRPPPGMG